MKQPSLFLAATITISFLPAFVCSSQVTNALPNGATYVGEMKDGKPNGHGTETLSNGAVYVGVFREGKPNGQGVS